MRVFAESPHQLVILGLVPGIHFSSWRMVATRMLRWGMYAPSTKEPADAWITGTSPAMTLWGEGRVSLLQ